METFLTDMKKLDFAKWLIEHRRFDSPVQVDIYMQQIINFQSDIVKNGRVFDLPMLMGALDDDSDRFDITQVYYEGIIGLCYAKPEVFFRVFVPNVAIMLPHALEISTYILSPILSEGRFRDILCEELEKFDSTILERFKKVYNNLIKVDNSLSDDRIKQLLV